MENATKALLIAAAVLIAIILISLGVSIVTSAQDQINQSSTALDAAEIETFNSKFKNYEGAAVSGTRVKTLARAIIQNNQTQEDASRKITLMLGNDKIIDPTSDSTAVPTQIGTGNRYKVECVTDASGLIKTINLTLKTSTSNGN